MPLLDIQIANSEILRLRIGIKKTTADGKFQYPSKLDTFRLTGDSRSILEECARIFGGEVREWEGHKGEFELITERKQLQVLISGEHSLSQDYEMWAGGGWTHRCDSETCLRRSKDGKEWSEPCPCAPIKAEWDEHRATYDLALRAWEQAGKPKGKGPKLPEICKPVSRLTFMLTEINSTGKVLFTSGGKIFASEVQGHFQTCKALGLPPYLFCILTLEEEEIKKQGQKAEKFPVVRIALDPNPPNFLGRIVQLVQSSQYVLPAPEQKQALNGHQAQALNGRTEVAPATNGVAKKRSNADLVSAHGLTQELYEEIKVKAKAKFPDKTVGDFLSEQYTAGQIGFVALSRILSDDEPPTDPGTEEPINAEFKEDAPTSEAAPADPFTNLDADPGKEQEPLL